MEIDERAHDEFRDHTIVKVVAWPEEAWVLDFSDGAGLVLNRADFDRDVPGDLVPREGDTLRIYRPAGSVEIHGVDLNGRRLWYRTRAERQARHQLELARFGRRLLEAAAPELAALPPPLRDLAERNISDGSLRGLLASQDATTIAALLRREHGWTDSQIVPDDQADRAIAAFKGLSREERRARIPELDGRPDVFGDACALAFALLTGKRVR